MVFGSRLVQGHELMARFAEMGWVCVSVQYRTSPLHRWPRQITDVKAAIAWARANVGRFGGDQSFIAVAGCSAGGHLATLAALTPNDPEWQKDLPPGADTSVDVVVSVYGRYDWQDRSTLERARFVEFLERVVVKRSQAKYPEAFRRASPVARVTAAAPPFLVVHGSRDAVIPVAEAREFVDRLRAVYPKPSATPSYPAPGMVSTSSTRCVLVRLCMPLVSSWTTPTIAGRRPWVRRSSGRRRRSMMQALPVRGGRRCMRASSTYTDEFSSCGRALTISHTPSR